MLMTWQRQRDDGGRGRFRTPRYIYFGAVDENGVKYAWRAGKKGHLHQEQVNEICDAVVGESPN